jgi:hypothetical protein
MVTNLGAVYGVFDRKIQLTDDIESAVGLQKIPFVGTNASTVIFKNFEFNGRPTSG